MANSTAKTATAFETFSGTLEERGSALAKLEKQRVTSLEKANTKDVVFNGLAYQLGQLIHELTLESDSGRKKLYRNFDAIQEWLKGRVVKKRKQKIAFTSLTAMLKAFKFETQPKVEKTDDKSSDTPSTKVDEKPNVGTTDQPKVETQDAKASDAQPKVETNEPKKVHKLKMPKTSQDVADLVLELTNKLQLDSEEVATAIFDTLLPETPSSKTGTNG
jgi:hypothetical protein